MSVIRDELWRSDTMAIYKVTYIGEHQEDEVNTILRYLEKLK